MTLECFLPEVQIWRLPNPKSLHWRHSVDVSPVRLRTHWTIKLVVGTLKLGKARNCSIQFILGLLHTFALLLLLPFLIVSLSSSPVARYVAASGLAAGISISGFHRLSVNYTLMPLISMTSKICAKLWNHVSGDVELETWCWNFDQCQPTTHFQFRSRHLGFSVTHVLPVNTPFCSPAIFRKSHKSA